MAIRRRPSVATDSASRGAPPSMTRPAAPQPACTRGARVGQSPDWDDDAELRPPRGDFATGGVSVRVPDVDAHYDRATAFGARTCGPPTTYRIRWAPIHGRGPCRAPLVVHPVSCRHRSGRLGGDAALV